MRNDVVEGGVRNDAVEGFGVPIGGRVLSSLLVMPAQAGIQVFKTVSSG